MIRGVLLALASAVAIALPTRAQDQAFHAVATEVLPGCLAHPSPKQLDYPQGAGEGSGGVVRVRLTFAEAAAVPRMEIYTNTAGDTFASTVAAYVERYRLGCPVAADRSTVLLQEFQFVSDPGRRVIVSPLRRKSSSSDCKWTIPPPPPYPHSTIHKVPDFGRVLVQLVFPAKGEAPKVHVLYDGGSAVFARTAREHAARAEYDCPAELYPVVGVIPYMFRMEGIREPLLDMSIALVDFLRTVEGVQGSRVYFDFRTMGCPFEFVIYPLQPENPNVTFWNPEPSEDRREFEAWLRSVKLGISRSLLDLHGGALKVRVPCVVLNLL